MGCTITRCGGEKSTIPNDKLQIILYERIKHLEDKLSYSKITPIFRFSVFQCGITNTLLKLPLYCLTGQFSHTNLYYCPTNKRIFFTTLADKKILTSFPLIENSNFIQLHIIFDITDADVRYIVGRGLVTSYPYTIKDQNFIITNKDCVYPPFVENFSLQIYPTHLVLGQLCNFSFIFKPQNIFS